MSKSLFGTYEAPYARKAIKKCREAGAIIAIATAETCPDLQSKKQQQFLKDIGIRKGDIQRCDTCGNYTGDGTDPTKCNANKSCRWIKDPYKDVPRSGPNMCVGIPTDGSKSIKGPMIKDILSRKKNVDKTKVIFFDDQQGNLDVGAKLGIQTQQASQNCQGKVCSKGTGLTKIDFKSGMEKVNNKPQICIFDIDNTLTRGSKASREDLINTGYISPFTIIFLLIAVISLILLFVV